VTEKNYAPDTKHTPEAVMLGPIVQDRPLLRDRKANRIRGRDFASVVDSPRAWVENDLPSRLPAASAPIHVIAIHEQAFIQ
jgi:hypothetical protein